MKNITLLQIPKTLTSLVVALACIASFVVSPSKANAEGTTQMNEMQDISSSTDVYVDILNAGEVINVSLCEDTLIEIYDINGTPADLSDDTLLDDEMFTANLDCSDPLPSPILNAYKYEPSQVGTYRIDFDESSERFDFSVTPNNTTEPDPSVDSGGRIWSYLWRFSTNDAVIYDDEYPEETSTDADLYAVVPAPVVGESFIWKLDLNNFAGGSYRLLANSIGLDAPYSGVSAWMDDSTVTPEFPIYLAYPEKPTQANSTTPSVSNFSFVDDDGEDDTFSPGTTTGVQDSGTFSFTSNVGNATYAITIDTNKDGIYGTGDRVLLGIATSGVNNVVWDGNYANGDPVGLGNYSAQIKLRIGEFHFVARDVEASGGTHNNTTWANGLAIYKATSATTQENTTLFWDDLSYLRVLAGNDDDGYTQTGDLYSDATSNLPGGVISGSTADANNDGKADGFHTWGDFEVLSMGDKNYVDTYTYGGVDSETTSLSVASVDGVDDDGISSGVEAAAPNGGDGNGDGTLDHLQDDVTSLPNSVVGSGAYTTVQVEGCPALSNVSISAESGLSAQDGSYDYPVGLLNFDIDCLAPGDSADITIFYDKIYDTSKWQARKFINGGYSNISGGVFSTANVGGTEVTILSYTVKDGGPLDEDGSENGTIVDPVGPGVTATEFIPAPGAAGTLAATGTEARSIIVNALTLVGVGFAMMLSRRKSRMLLR